MGKGTEVTTELTPKLKFRFGFDQLQDIDRCTKKSINYKLDLKFRSTSLLFDWHPFGGSFRTSLGMLVNGSRLRVNAVPAQALNLDNNDPSDMELASLLLGDASVSDTSIKASDLLTAKGRVSFRSVAPYLGVGWGNATHSNRRLLYTVDIGVAFYGSPEVDLDVAGIAADLSREQANHELQAFLASEEKRLENKLKDFDIFPVVAFGLWYRF